MELLWMLHDIRTPLGNVLVQYITYLGEGVFLLSILCALYWCFDKKLATKIGFTFITSGMLVQGLKITFRIPRPWVLDPAFQPVDSAIEAATGYSFPSGHTQSATSLFAPLALNSKKAICKFLFSTCFLLVAFSRMYLGVHTFKDVFVAILITCTISFLVEKFQHILIDNAKYTKHICIGIFAVAIFLLVYSPLLHKLGYIEAHYVDDCYKVIGAAIGLAVGFYLEQTTLNFTPAASPKRFIIGFLSTLVLYVIPKLIFPGIAIWKLLRYLIVILWIIYIYPYLFTKFSK